MILLVTKLMTPLLRDSQQMKSSLAMWVFFCSETSPEEFAEYGDCLNMQYQGEISLAAVAKFMKNLRKQVLVKLNELYIFKNKFW